MSRTFRIHNHPAVVIAATLLAVGSAAAVADSAIVHNPAIVDVPHAHPTFGPEPHGLTAVDRKAAQRLAELRAQRAADLACIGPVYPVRAC